MCDAVWDEQKCSFVDVGRREMFKERDFIVSSSRVTQEIGPVIFSKSTQITADLENLRLTVCMADFCLRQNAVG
jgi:hypothetical protein